MMVRSIAAVALALFVALFAADAREVYLLDDGWRFQLGENPQANARDFADGKWRVLDLPHDWSIEGTVDPEAPSQGDGGYFPTGVGWYRRELEVKPEWQGKRVWVDFEGVATSCEVWINGEKIGEHHYAYTPIHFDITDHLDFDKRNVIAVRVDNSHQPNSRWYTGSGIYRHVRLTVVDPVHIEHNGLIVSTHKLTDNEAQIDVTVNVVNESNESWEADYEGEIVDCDGNFARGFKGSRLMPSDSLTKVKLQLNINSPRLWSPTEPHLYSIKCKVGGEDIINGLFGIRTIDISADKGFLLNGKPIELCGACVHHDNGPLGAAAFDRAEERRVEQLKAAGFNAIRTAHNPPSTAFLNACDRLGMLVIDEAFDGWASAKKQHDYSTVFQKKWKSDLRAMIDRDRNHPCVVMWSIGNEVYERGNENGRRIARELADYVRRLDPTRPVGLALNGLGDDKKWPELDDVFASVDVAGYNYETHQHKQDHQRVPERVVFLSETYARSAFESWEAVSDHPYVVGDFVWSGIDYLGESGIGRVFTSGETMKDFWEIPNFPWHGATCGDLDITLHRKPLSHYRQILWDRGERLYMAVETPSPDGKPWQLSKWAHPPLVASWTWPGYEAKPMKVEVFSRHETARLYLNGEVIEEKPTGPEQEFCATFIVPYAAGKLRVVGISGDKEVEDFELSTAGPASSIRLQADKSVLIADNQDLAFIEVEVVDHQGMLRPDAAHSIEYKLKGPGSIVAVGSADLASRESYQANPRRAYQGRALVTVRTTHQPGTITLTATAKGLEPAKISVASRASE